MTTQEEKVIAAEVTKTYHSVKHCLSFNSLDCDTKLDHILYNDSKIPASTQEAVEILEYDTFYSLATDASNHGRTWFEKEFPPNVPTIIQTAYLSANTEDFTGR
ncbi:unnamed protein product [Colias eurytheme]|nr:unnamed protein product [Colias eurytheme]